MLIDLLKDPSSYNLRERFAREVEVVRTYFKFNINQKEFYMGIKIIEILLKFNKNYLTLSHTSNILSVIRYTWI